jgi:hypothetical protein
VHAEAHVRPEREREVLALVAVDVELLGALPVLLVVIGRAHVGDDDCAGRDLDAVDDRVARRGPHDRRERRLPAQPLLDRLRHQRAVGAQRVELVGIGEQPEQQVARGAVRRLRTGRKEQPEEREDLLVREVLTVQLGDGERAHEIVRRVSAPVGKNSREVVAQLGRGARAAVPVERDADELDRPAMELREVLAGEPEHPCDHVHRERQRALAHELGLAAVDERVDALVDDRTDHFGFPAFHRLTAERLLHEPAVGVVLGLVHLEDGVAHDRAHDVGVSGRRERLAVAQDGLHGVVAEGGEDLGTGRGRGAVGEQLRLEVLLEHRPLLPGHGQQRVRVLDNARADAAVELLERVVGAVDSLGRAHEP